jgi:hypothetical protein
MSLCHFRRDAKRRQAASWRITCRLEDSTRPCGQGAGALVGNVQNSIKARPELFFLPLPHTAAKPLQAAMKYVLVSGGVISGVGKVRTHIVARNG